jgi:hypothetical protein
MYITCKTVLIPYYNRFFGLSAYLTESTICPNHEIKIMGGYYNTRHFFIRRAYYWCLSKNEICIFRQLLIKIRNEESNENASGGLGSNTWGRADKRAEAKSRISQFFFCGSAYKRFGTTHVILERTMYSDWKTEKWCRKLRRKMYLDRMNETPLFK